jgi:hypothetical protein
MGLAEKRLAEKIKTTSYVALVDKIQAAAGYPLALNIDWNTFIAYDEYPLTRLEGDMFNHIEEFVKGICIDDMGKEALKENLVSIELSNTDDGDKLHMELKDKKLNLVFQLAGGSYRYHGSSEMISSVEKLL